MKGVIIEPESGDEPLGIGLECPDCGEDMKKFSKIAVRAQFDDEEGKMATAAGEAPITEFRCPVCGYKEEIQ